MFVHVINIDPAPKGTDVSRKEGPVDSGMFPQTPPMWGCRFHAGPCYSSQQAAWPISVTSRNAISHESPCPDALLPLRAFFVSGTVFSLSEPGGSNLLRRPVPSPWQGREENSRARTPEPTFCHLHRTTSDPGQQAAQVL